MDTYQSDPFDVQITERQMEAEVAIVLLKLNKQFIPSQKS